MGGAKESRISIDRYFEFCVLGVVASGYFALLGSGLLDTASMIVGAGALMARALLISGLVPLRLPDRAANLVLLAYLGFYAIDATVLSGALFTATVHLVFVTAGLKLLAAKRPRDYVLVSVIGFVAILAAAVLSASLAFFVFLTCFLVFAIAALASAEIGRAMRERLQIACAGGRWFHLRLAGLTVWMAIGVFVLTGGLFFILPRTAQAAFDRLLPRRLPASGFSTEIRLGGTGEIRQRGAAVMHIRVVDAPHPEALKWRGAALSEFDGTRWYDPPDPGRVLAVNDGRLEVADLEQRWRKGVRIRYEVQLSAIGTDALFFAGHPEVIRIDSPTLLQTAAGGYRLGVPPSRGVRYGAYSLLEETAERRPEIKDEPPAIRNADLQLPALDPRVTELARRITDHADTAAARAGAIERYLRQNYAYTTKLLSREVSDPLANFLLKRRAGHCEYFASAMAVMLRVVGIPARVATGFLGGVYNPVSGWWIVRAEDAHSWVEAYLPGSGWTTFDPTPPADRPEPSPLWSKLGFYLDAADTFWQQWVLDYNLEQQLVLAHSGRSYGVRWQESLRGALSRFMSTAGRLAVFAALLLLAAGVGRVFGPRALARWRTARRVRQVQRGRAQSGDATLLYERMLANLKGRGFERPAWVTPAEFARLLPASETAALVRDFTVIYNDMRFGGRLEAAPRIVALLEAIEQRRH